MTAFTWRDGDRTIRFGRGAAAEAPELLGGGYTLLTTPRAAAAAPDVVASAAARFDVPNGLVDEISAALLDEVRGVGGGTLVALGGGRVIDTAKALGAATGRAVGAIPTTLSAAEMTVLHRQVAGIDPVPAPVRPRVVVNDPALSASQPGPALAASAANSLAHAVEAAASVRSSPVPSLAAREAARLTAEAYAGGAEEPGEDGRDALALAALLSGYAIDAAWYGLHHVLAQTLVRVAGVGHGPANAALLPHTMRALTERGVALVAEPALAERLAALAGAATLDVSDENLDRAAAAAARRSELRNTPPPAGEDEIRALYAAVATPRAS